MENILFVCRKHAFRGGITMLPACYFAFVMSSCGAKSRFRTSKESRMTVLLVNCTFTCLMSFAPIPLASRAVTAPSALMVRRNEPMSPRRTVLPFSNASITSYCKASNTAFTSALDTVERFSIRFMICASVTGVVGAACG